MLQANFTTIREIQRNYRKIGEEVNKTDTPTIVMSKNKPQFAIVSLKTVEKLEKERAKKPTQTLLDLASWAEEQDFNLPKDLSTNHDKYTWGK